MSGAQSAFTARSITSCRQRCSPGESSGQTISSHRLGPESHGPLGAQLVLVGGREGGSLGPVTPSWSLPVPRWKCWVGVHPRGVWEVMAQVTGAPAASAPAPAHCRREETPFPHQPLGDEGQGGCSTPASPTSTRPDLSPARKHSPS